MSPYRRNLFLWNVVLDSLDQAGMLRPDHPYHTLTHNGDDIMHRTATTLSIVAALSFAASAAAAETDETTQTTSSAAVEVEAGVAWYGDWDAALAEAKRSNRPIMLQFARPACRGVSGVF